MSYFSPAPGVTVCEDTHENWKEFYELKARLLGEKPEDERPEMRLSRRRNTNRRCYGHRGSMK